MSDLHDDATNRALRTHADLGLDPDGEATITNALIGRGDHRRRARTSPRWRAVLIGAAATVSVVGVAAAATGLWNPSLGDDQRGHPSAASTDVPAVQLDRFGVLRRAADATDRDATTEHALRYLDSRFEGVRTQRIRAVHGLAPDRRVLIVPVKRSNDGTADALCLYAVDGEGGGIGCWSTEQALSGQAVLRAVPGVQDNATRSANDLQSLRPSPSGATTIGLVPDGVAVVAADGVRADVTDNAYVLPALAPSAASVTWLDRRGEVIPRR